MPLQTLLNLLPKDAPEYTAKGLYSIAMLIVGWGGWKTLKAIQPYFLPVVDDMWFGSFKRNAARVEVHLRDETFHHEIVVRGEMEELLRSTAQLTETNAQAIAQIVAVQQQAQRDVLTNYTHLTDAIRAGVAPVADSMNDLANEVQFVKGQLDIVIKHQASH